MMANRAPRRFPDPYAAMLAKRLDGLPLALATAGTYLNQTVVSFSDYLQLYNNRWDDLRKYSDELLDYKDRTLYSTWNLSLQQVRSQDPEAAELLRLMAYLDNQDVWYELFQAGVKDLSLWWSDVVENEMRFNRTMSKLYDYSLIEKEIITGSYSLHTCVHDWTLEYLNRGLDDKICQIAVHCVAESVKWETEKDYWVINRRLVRHAQRLKYNRIQRSISWSSIDMKDLFCIGYLYSQLDMKAEAEEMYIWALRGYEEALGPEHTSTLDTVNNLGRLYADQGKVAEAEEMYMRALRGYEKALGSEHTSTLDTVNNLGSLYADQDRMAEAEGMYMRALQGYEKAWGPEHTSVLNTINNLGLLYQNQSKMVEAEEMYMRALRGYEKAWGPEHTSTLDTVNNLGSLYADQGRMAEAEGMYMRALQGYEKAWGPEHTSVLNTINNLGLLYQNQSKMVEAEEMYMRALRGYERAMGVNHPRTRATARNLDVLRALR
jgi:tetratricopeptide (TPR) repeat protein